MMMMRLSDHQQDNLCPPPVASCASTTTTDHSRDETDNPQEQQLLVSFQNVTRVVRLPAKLRTDDAQAWTLMDCATHSHWPLSSLSIRHWKLPFVTIVNRSSLRGGKGGFGTLLKGQARQAGATMTMDFGACRDLQGRRLRHVNDELKLRQWRERQERQANGKVDDKDDLWKTPSGLYNWHLMTPTWADISKKATRRIRRQFQQMDRQEEVQRKIRKEQEDLQQNTMAYYLEQTEAASKTVQSNLGDVLQQGLLAAADKKRKRTNTLPKPPQEQQTLINDDGDDQQPNSLCTLSGDIMMVNANTNQTGTLRIQGQSDFATAVLILDQNPSSMKKKIVYYEVSVVTGGLAQIGWAILTGKDDEAVVFEPNDGLGDGVGDDAASFAVDGSRGLKFHGGEEQAYSCSWKAGDRIGCQWNVETGDLSYTVNGKSQGVAFPAATNNNTEIMLMPAISCNRGQILEVHISAEDCQHLNPSRMLCVSELLQATPDNEEGQQRKSSKTTEEKSTPSHKNDTPQVKMMQPKQVPKPPVPVVVKPPVVPELLDLRPFDSADALEELGLDRLKSALMALQVKCG